MTYQAWTREDDMTTWRQLIQDVLEEYPGEHVIAVAPDESALDVKFDSGYGAPQGPIFTAWTQNRVLFPVCYDGAESVRSVPRSPGDEETRHVGGY
jgi:hypothetical protein